MMFIGAALMALVWIFVRYRGLDWSTLFVWACGSCLVIYGMMTAMNDAHHVLIRN